MPIIRYANLAIMEEDSFMSSALLVAYLDCVLGEVKSTQQMFRNCNCREYLPLSFQSVTTWGSNIIFG